MGIGNRIKEARNNLGYTQEELAKLLGVTKGAVANYELETSHPKEPIMYKLIEVLKINTNYLFQDCVNIPNELNNVTLAEYNMVKKYRELDKRGKEMVDSVLEQAYNSIPCAVEGQISLLPIDGYYQIFKNGKWENYIKEEEFQPKSTLNAAHSIAGATDEDNQNDNDIMDDKNF